MLGMDRAYVIKHKWHHEGLSIRQIARDLGVSRNTVRKYVDAEGEPRRREAADKRPQPVLDEVRERIDELLQEWGRRTTPKQRITGTLVHEQLLREGPPSGQHDGTRLSGREAARASGGVPAAGVARRRRCAGGLLRGDGGGGWRAAESVAVRAAPDVLGAGLCVAVRTLQPGCLSGRPRARLQASGRGGAALHLRQPEGGGEAEVGDRARTERAVSGVVLTLSVRAVLCASRRGA